MTAAKIAIDPVQRRWCDEVPNPLWLYFVWVFSEGYAQGRQVGLDVLGTLRR